MRTDTILMGDATNPPVLKAAAGFNGQILINGECLVSRYQFLK